MDELAQKQMEEERMMFELAICQRIARGQATLDDALYVAGSFGLTKQFQQDERIAA